MELTDKQTELIYGDGHLLVTGGPGSGKTTISILKAARIVESELAPEQKVLFLSFARASVSRVIEAIEQEQSIGGRTKRQIEVETYHSFFWRILKAHGYLIGLPRQLDILAPPGEAIALSAIRNKFEPDNKISDNDKAKKKGQEAAERRRIAFEEGRICFDLFAPFVGELLHASARLRRLISTRYPIVVLDEFQDTNPEQWGVVQALGVHSQLISLADPEQRIYDFIGADPERLNHFREHFSPTEIDFSDSNHRSNGTEITKFGNDVLLGRFQQENYSGIQIYGFDPFPDPAITRLVTMTYAARARLLSSGNPDWSLAILVPTKRMTRIISDRFQDPPGRLQAIPHNAVIELEAAILGSEIVAHLLQTNAMGDVDVLVDLLCNYYQGKGGDRPTNAALEEANRIRKAYAKWNAALEVGKRPPGNSMLHATFQVCEAVRSIELTGNPDQDWLTIKASLENGDCRRLKEVGTEVRNLRLLKRGTQLRQDLSEDWRINGCYANALATVQQAFVREHFATNSRPETGVVVMNMHKAKGKQFDEVIIFEGWPVRQRGRIVANPDRIVRNNDRAKVNDGVKQNFRVSVTRARQRTTILTPRGDPCVLLVPE